MHYIYAICMCVLCVFHRHTYILCEFIVRAMLLSMIFYESYRCYWLDFPNQQPSQLQQGKNDRRPFHVTYVKFRSLHHHHHHVCQYSSHISPSKCLVCNFFFQVKRKCVQKERKEEGRRMWTRSF
jgi:hypothetical protein